MEDYTKWIEIAKKDLKAARDSFNTGNYEWASFQAQQSVEKALKALQIKRTGKFYKIHDLVKLGKDVGLPNNLIDNVKELTLAYVYTRYLDVPRKSNLKDKASYFLKISENVLRWVEENL